MQAELLLLRIIHIVGGTVWVGTMVFVTFFLAPALRATGPIAATQVMGALQQRKLFTWMPIIALLTILSGLRLMMIVSGGDSHWFVHPAGHAYAAAAALAVIAFAVGISVSRPAMRRMGKLTQTAASDETSKRLILDEMSKLQMRARAANLAVSVLLLAATLGMAIARYL